MIAYGEAITAEVRGVPVSVCFLEDLKAMKRAASGMPKRAVAQAAAVR